jgi:hypothetical protein
VKPASAGGCPRRFGLWLYAPQAEPLVPPGLDFLIENCVEDTRREITAMVTQHGFHTGHGRLRVTSDSYREEGGVSAWWLHADSAADLFHLARPVWWCGNLPTALRAWTEAGRSVMDRLHDADRDCKV